jgi:hypothetical protein
MLQGPSVLPHLKRQVGERQNDNHRADELAEIRQRLEIH